MQSSAHGLFELSSLSPNYMRCDLKYSATLIFQESWICAGCSRDVHVLVLLTRNESLAFFQIFMLQVLTQLIVLSLFFLLSMFSTSEGFFISFGMVSALACFSYTNSAISRPVSNHFVIGTVQFRIIRVEHY